MLTQQYQKLRLRSKSNLKRHVLQIIPVLSIFVLLGMMGLLFIVDTGSVNGEAYAAGDVSSGTSASLIIDNGNIVDRISAVHSETAYASHVVKVSASNITDYALTITGPTSLTGASAINGTDGTKTGANLADNTWGYAWDSTSKTEAEMTYNSFTGAAQTLTGNPAVNNNAVDFERKLAFAAKFGTDAVEGHYTASVNLNLVATPYIVVGIWNTNGTTVDSGITYMDQMTETVCNQVATPVVGTLPHSVPTMALKDRRDSKTYRVARLTDGKCWMIDNLALDLSVAGIASKEYSDNLTADYPATALENKWETEDGPAWVNINTEEEFSKAPALVNSSAPGDGNGYQAEYGYYYSWCAVTAGCKTSSGANPAKNENAVGSICPKGWQIPSGNSNSYANNDFINLMQGTNYNGWDGSTLVNDTAFPVTDFTGKYVVAAQLGITNTVPATFYLGGAYWYRSGAVYANGRHYTGIGAAYWSRTAGSGTYAHFLDLNKGSGSDIYPANSYNRYAGIPVRCVAEELEPEQEITYSIKYQSGNGYVLNTGSILPKDQTETGTGSSHTMTISNTLPQAFKGSECMDVLDWLGDDGIVYKAGQTVTPTKEKPNLILVPNSATKTKWCVEDYM